jgi:predicted permease
MFNVQCSMFSPSTMTDFKFAIRQFVKNPGFTAVAVLTLALGIGATTAIFSVVYAVVLRPLPFPESERLVAIWTQTPQVAQLPMAAANHRDLKSQNTVFEDVAMLSRFASYNLTGVRRAEASAEEPNRLGSISNAGAAAGYGPLQAGDGEPERLPAARVAANLFPLLRVKPALGRGFTEVENQPGQDRVVILSHGLWQRRYAGDPNIVGKTIRLENVPHTVVGVMSPEFQYPTREVQIWTPLTINPDNFRTRTGFGHLCVARLKPGVTLEQAQTEVNLIATRLAHQYPEKNKEVRFSVAPLRQDIAGVARKPLTVVLGAALGLLLIGCCNLVNLLLARTLARSRETAIRSALGANRSRLVRQAAAELLPILALGAIAGVLAAQWGIRLLIPWLPAALPRVEEIEVNLPVLSFSGAVLCITAVLVLLLPVMLAARFDLVATLREDSRTASGSAGRAMIRNLLVIGQVALTVILLAGAGLLIRTFAALKDVEPGFRPQGVLSLRLAIPRNKYGQDDQVAAFCQRILEQVRALPGVQAAGMSNRLPLDGASGLSSIEFERPNQEPGTLEATDETITTPDYFQAMGIPVLDGRSFTEQDTTNAALAVVVDERVARLAWPGENPIGKRVRGGGHRPWAEVVGVVGHIRHESLERDQRLQIYWNYLQSARDRMTLVVRTSGLRRAEFFGATGRGQVAAATQTGEPRSLVNAVLGAIRAVDPDQPAYAVRTMTEVLDRYLALRWFNTLVVSLFAGSSLILAMVGIYGVIAWTVRHRTREIGVRMALGAQRDAVLALVLRSGLKLAGVGIILGLIGAVGLTRLLHSLLFGVGPTDPLTFVAVPVLLVSAALLASWLPARRAAGVNPMEALRCE